MVSVVDTAPLKPMDQPTLLKQQTFRGYNSRVRCWNQSLLYSNLLSKPHVLSC